MDFAFSEEQDLLRSTARDVLTGVCPPQWTRGALEGGAEPPRFWSEVSKLGWLGIAAPEADGGAGGTFIDQVVLLEEMGRALAPGSYAATACAAAPVIAALAGGEQRDRLLTPLLDGSRRATLIAGDERRPGDVASLPIRATANGGSTVLTGGPVIVAGAAGADTLVVAARDGDGDCDGVSVFAVDRAAPNLQITPLHGLDASRGLARVSLDEVEVGDADRLGDRGGAGATVAAVVDRATVAACAELCGAGEVLLNAAVEYAKVREQFGRPIGSFQAVKHLCADMLVRLESSRAAVYYAALCIDQGRDDAPLTTSIAKAFAGEQIALLAEDAVQVHGGIGFTWESDVHLFVRRTKAIEQLWGATAWHRERVAQLIGA